MQTQLSSRRRGFSMIELLVVITLIGVISLMAMGRTSAMMTQWRVTRAAQAYAEELQSAFAIVGRDRKPVRIVYDSVKMELYVINRDSSIFYRKRSMGPSSAYKLDFNQVKPSQRDLWIFPPGLAADTLSVTFTRQGKFRRVRLLRGGLVQVCGNPSTLNGVCTPA